MPRRLLFLTLTVALLLLGIGQSPPQARSRERAAAPATDPYEESDEACAIDAAMIAALQEQFQAGGVLADNWPPDALGGLVPPLRSVHDPYPTYDGLAFDPLAGRVIMSDENRHSMLVYDRTAGSASTAVTEPIQQIFGRRTQIGFVAGVEVDPVRQEFYTVNNDGGDKLVVFTYDQQGDVVPTRSLVTPHQSWDVALAPKRDEIAISVQQSNAISFFRRAASGHDAPVRTIRGLSTELHDPHGVFFDEQHNEIITANHGNWTQIRPYTSYDPLVTDVGEYKPGAFYLPSITFHRADANGDVAPLRVIQGSLTRLNWPMGLDLDAQRGEIAVANYGDDSILVFARGGGGDVQPTRVIRGPATEIVGPISVAIDAKNDEIWLANYGDHTALVFPRTAAGNVKPKRIIRNAPAKTPTCGFTNASAAAFDTKRDALLVPN
jgi:6-phosphogluconolactonase (cycloisomerase 2 family)